MLLNFGRTRSPDESSHEMGVTSQHRWEDPPQRIGEPDWRIPRAGAFRLIDTLVGSHNSHYVKRSFR